MVIRFSVRLLFVFVFFASSLSAMSVNFIGKLINAGMIGHSLYQTTPPITYDGQLQAYTRWDGYREGRDINYSGEDVSGPVRDNINRIAEELGIKDIKNFQIKKMTNPRACLTTLGIAVTNNFIFVQEDNEPFSSGSEKGIIKLIDFGNEYSIVATFFIKQALLQYQQSFYNKKVAHQIGLGLSCILATSYAYNFCTQATSKVVGDIQFQNPLAWFAFETTKFLGTVTLSMILQNAAHRITCKYKSVISDYVYYHIINSIGTLNIDNLLSGLDEIKRSNSNDSRIKLIDKQIAILNQIKKEKKN